MTADRSTAPRANPVVSSPATSTRSRWKTLPPDVLRQSCGRVRIMAITIASMWAIALLMNHVVAPLLGHTHRNPDPTKPWTMVWPFPGTQIAFLGIVISALTYAGARMFCEKPKAVINVGLALQIVTAALITILIHWHPVITTAGISWLCLIILVHPSVVPTPPIKTLLVSLLIATLDPLAVWFASLRGMPMDADAYTLVWYFLPNYISVALAMIPAKIIMGLGRQVNQARDLGSYQIGELLGRGGMGEVYAARHRLLARPAAIKLIRPETIGAGNSEAAQLVIQRFRREAQAAALLRSPHTISLYDFGMTDEGTFYYVMELLEGFDLETLVKRFGPVHPPRAIHILRHACHSLSEAHTRNLIHRDIKPSNIFACRLGLSVDFVKVLDFGLVKHQHGSAQDHTVLVTQPNVTTGTPAFMAPEMALGEGVTTSVDIYALGCVGYWLLTGRLVFDGETPVKMMLQHIQSVPAPPSQVSELDIPPELDRIILACLSKKPADRPQTTKALAQMLAEVPVREFWSSERAEEWWANHAPASAPATPIREETPVATMHAVK
ncbi:MAG TPA: serine/threonine-protein kinase [Candidatus Eisenbacteria bacterium]|nr:serine/threonine-protein kinase [Candidatus Eisenbacteria bacterium]